MSRTELVHRYCDAVEADPRAHPIQPARRLIPWDAFQSVADLYAYSVCSFTPEGRALEPQEAARDAAWIIFDNVYLRNSGGRSPGNAHKGRAASAGFIAKGGPRNPERASLLWQGAIAKFGGPASTVGPMAPPSFGTKMAVEAATSPQSLAPVADSETDVTKWALAAVKATDEAWNAARRTLVTGDAGYMVFYSPVRPNPKLLLVGANPGGGAESFNRALALSIPTGHDYFTYDYPLARRMKAVFAEIGHSSTLRNSVKINLNFFRSRDQQEWKANPAAERRRLESFCRATVVEGVRRLLPAVILAEGIATYDALEDTLGARRQGETLHSARGVRLFCTSKLPTGATLVGMVHPTGFRVSATDWALIKARLKAELDKP